MAKYTYTLSKVVIDHIIKVDRVVTEIQADGVRHSDSFVEFYVEDEIGDKTVVAFFTTCPNTHFNITSVENNNA